MQILVQTQMQILVQILVQIQMQIQMKIQMQIQINSRGGWTINLDINYSQSEIFLQRHKGREDTAVLCFDFLLMQNSKQSF